MFLLDKKAARKMSRTSFGNILFVCIYIVNIYTVVGFGESCTDSSNCTQNSEVCTDGNCTCNTANNYYYNGNQCDLNINECDSNPCQHGTCTDAVNRYTCSCFAGYTGINCQTNIDVCAPKPCLNGGTCRDLINDFSCDCKDGYSAKTCSSAALDAACGMSGTSCQTLNAECGSEEKICLCESSYYKKSSTCSPVSELRVKGITFPANSVTTSGFKVIWTHPDMASYVNNYLIDWRLKTPDNSLNNGGNQEVLSSVTSHVISTGVTAGRTYTVSVTSKNTQTQSNVPRTTSVSKEQAAKPNKPGAIDKGRSDLHASAGNPGITLYWTHPSGGVSGYKLTLSDGTNTSPSDSVSAVVTFNLSWLRNGHRYNVTIQAKSELYGSQNEFVLGEIYREEIKTVVTEPTEPRSVNCKEIYDESIVLGWGIPSEPNGDLIRYTVNVYDSKQVNLFNRSTSGVAYTLKIENLKPGTHYTFKVFTQNEQYVSTTSGDITCPTKAKLSDPPHDLRVSVITSRNFTVQWDKPNNTYSEENLGYVIQNKEGEKCIKEIVYRCSDCIGSFQPSALENVCEFSVRTVLSRTKSQLTDTQLRQFLSLIPDTSYTVTAAAVSSKGRGNVATITLTTNEEVPQTPFSVEVADITSTSFLVAWSINGDRPGKTNFTVHVTADSPASSKNITVIGFETRSKLVENLEEFWSYIVSVEAYTSLGSRKSLPTTKQQTLPAAPGKISDFRITDAPGGNYTQMKVTWKAPGILQRNSIIKEYKFVYYIEENSKFPQSLPHEPSDTYEYTVSVDVRPEQTYTVQVLAVNEQGQDGQKTVANKTTQAGVPVNIEYTLQVNIISAYGRTDRAQGMFSVTIVPEFFEESTNGRVRATGLLACAKNCDFSKIKTLQDFNNLKNWKQASNDGFTLYRLTYPAWLLNTYAQTPCSGRRKRAISNLIYTVGQEDCTDVAPDDYCNGPLTPNTKFLIVAVSCTNGGCLLSKEYGPFSTLPAPTSTVQDCNCTTQTVIVGVVLGLIIVILSLYAGYVTLLIRRNRVRKDYIQDHTTKKENKREQLYANELFTERTAGVEGRSGNPATIKDHESEYSRLDDASREEKAQYEVICAM